MADYWNSIKQMLSGDSGEAVPRKRSLFEPAPDDLQLLVTGDVPPKDGYIEKSAGPGVDYHSQSETRGNYFNLTSDPADQPSAGEFEKPSAEDTLAVEQIETGERRDLQNLAPGLFDRNDIPNAENTDTPGDTRQEEAVPRAGQGEVPVSNDLTGQLTEESSFAPGEFEEQDHTPPVIEEYEPQVEAEDIDITDVEIQVARIHNELEEVDAVVPATPVTPPQEQPESAPMQPLIIEIGQVDITIARPGSPAQSRPPAHEPSKPVIELDAYLAQSDKRRS